MKLPNLFTPKPVTADGQEKMSDKTKEKWVLPRTPEALEAWGNETEGNIKEAVVPLDSYNDKPAFFFVHSMGGNGAADYSTIAGKLKKAAHCFAISVPTSRRNPESVGSIEEMAKYYAKELTVKYPEGPIMLGGWSTGATIALEMAQQLSAPPFNREIKLLVAFDEAPAKAPLGVKPKPLQMLSGYGRSVREYYRSDPEAFKNHLRVAAGQKSRVEEGASKVTSDGVERPPHFAHKFMDISKHTNDFVSFMEALEEANAAYVPKRYSGKVVVYESKYGPLRQLEWAGAKFKKIAPLTEVVRMDVNHDYMMYNAQVGPIAEDLRNRILEVSKENPEQTSATQSGASSWAAGIETSAAAAPVKEPGKWSERKSPEISSFSPRI